MAFVVAGHDPAPAATAAAAPDEGVEYVPIPLPYALPPQPYVPSDAPWMVDADSDGTLDSHGLRREDAGAGMYGYTEDGVTAYFQENN